MKGREDTARAHVVPLAIGMLQILEKLPTFADGDCLFSRNVGRTPAVMSAEFKSDLDRRMLRTLRGMARKRSDDVAAVKLEPWVQHDLRRLVRSGLRGSRLLKRCARLSWPMFVRASKGTMISTTITTRSATP